MVQINFAQKQVKAKVVFYGPGMSGKTTNLEVVHQRAPDANRGDLTSISTDGDRTLFFDYMPLDLGTVAGMKTSFQIYTVPGQVYYNSTRKLVLQGVDGVVFVADSSGNMVQENLESLRNLEENLNEYGKSLATLPHVIQFNKRDLPDAMSVEEMDKMLNNHGAPTFEAIANTGQGVFPTLKALASSVLKNIMQERSGSMANAPAPAAPQPSTPAAPPVPAASAQPAAPMHQTGFQPAPPPVQPAGAPPAPAPLAAQAQPTAAHPNLSQTGAHPAPTLHQTGFQPQRAPGGAPGAPGRAAPPPAGPPGGPAGGPAPLMQPTPGARGAQRPRARAAQPVRPAGARQAVAPTPRGTRPRTQAAAVPAPPKRSKAGVFITVGFVVVASAVGGFVAWLVMSSM